jgi:hypothetical protein
MCAHDRRARDRIVHDARHERRLDGVPSRPRRLYGCSVVDPDVVDRIASASAEELASALGIPRGRAVDRALGLASLPLARALARFDDITRQRGVASAAADLLGRRGVSLRIQGDPPAGPGLVLVNHPGAWDAIALMAACGRREVSIVANDRAFLRAIPSLERLLLFVPEQGGALERARATREVVRRIRAGGLVVHFGAGCIEIDPAFDALEEPSWARGVVGLPPALLLQWPCQVRPSWAFYSVVLQGAHSRARVRRTASWRGRCASRRDDRPSDVCRGIRHVRAQGWRSALPRSTVRAYVGHG